MTERFENQTDEGNEKAIKRGRVVPEDAVNLAYVKVPQLSPRENVVVVDASRVVEENVIKDTANKVYYANSLGILEDEDGNQVIHDQFPYVTDEFSIDEDFNIYPGSEYKSEHVLPFVHVSRHFHLDKIGLTLPGDLTSYRSENIKVLDSKGRPYVRVDGTPRYRVKITSAIHPQASESAEDAAYRVHVYVDTNTNEELYLSYNKVELTVNGLYRNQQINYKELLNPQPVFDYRPEESEVADVFNRQKKIYSTKALALKDQILGNNVSAVDGYKVYVPKKALADPRIFQLFHWRLSCDFTSYYTVDPSRRDVIRCGIISTNPWAFSGSSAPYAFYNLEQSRFNATGVTFENPLYEDVAPGTDIPAKNSFAYWKVDLNTVQQNDLRKFDILLWSPDGPWVDFAPYNALVDFYVNTVGGTLFVDTNNYTIPANFMFGTSATVNPATGVVTSRGEEESIKPGKLHQPLTFSMAHPVMNAGQALGGWAMYDGSNNDERNSISTVVQTPGAEYCQRIYRTPNGIPWPSGGVTPGVDYVAAGRRVAHDYVESLVSSQVTPPANGYGSPSGIPLNQPVSSIEISPTGKGYWMAAKDGGVFNYGDAVFYGALPPQPLNKSVVGIAATPSGKGYWLAGADGGVFAFGDAKFKGSLVGATPPVILNQPIVDIASTTTGEGYWLVAADGGVFAFGDAVFYGSATNITLNEPIVGMAATPSGKGYWLVAGDGGVFNYGNAPFKGASPPLRLNQDMVGMVATASGQGYRLVASDGGVFCYGDAQFHGSLGLTGSVLPIVGMAANKTGTAYWLVATDGGIFPFGRGDLINDAFVSMYTTGSKAGDVVFSTLGILNSCSRIYDYLTGEEVNRNIHETAWSDDNYELNINSIFVEGAMKLLFNVCLNAVKGRGLDSTDERVYSTSWSHSTKWNSSWVIKPDGGVLSQEERDKHDFFLLPRDPFSATPDVTPTWKRRLDVRTCKELIESDFGSDPIMLRRAEGTERTYYLEISSNSVRTDSVLLGHSAPYAFTEEYSPAFKVPVELGPHVVVAEERKGDYADAQFEQKVYPSKPYQFQVRTAFVQTEEEAVKQSLNYVVYGRAVIEKTTTSTTPPTTTTRTSEISLSWWDYPKGGSRQFALSDKLHRTGVIAPVGVQTWQDENYRTSLWGSGKLNWPFWGFTGRYKRGSSGEVVKFVQEALNRFIGLGYMSHAYLRVDGIYGAQTESAIYALQRKLGARYVDGIIDAETWSLIGYQILRGGSSILVNTRGNDHTKYFHWPHNRIMAQNISDNNEGNLFAKRSWVSGGPSIIWELFSITYDKKYPIHAVTLVPYLEGAYNRLMFRSIMVTNSPFDLTNFDSKWSQITYMPHRPSSGERFRVNCGPYHGDTLVVGIGQDRGAGSGWGSARMLGVRDVVAHANVSSTTVVPGTTKITKQEHEIEFQVSGSADVAGFRDVSIQLMPPSDLVHAGETIKEIVYEDVWVSNPSVSAAVTPTGRLTFKSAVAVTSNDVSFTSGPVVPLNSTPYYSMNEAGVVSPVPETGFISKMDGVKLFCDISGKPIGFPILPQTIGENELQRHYVKMSAVSLGTDAMVHVGFYDKKAKEFIVSAEGKPEMSYLELVQRGPSNIYVAAVSSYEMIEQQAVPYDDDAPLLPYRWAMPVYGVQQQKGSRITLESLPPNLGYRDVWPIAVRRGSFVREVNIRPTTLGYLTNYLKDYQGTKVTAYYGLPEADRAGWSPIYGPPNSDIVGESPAIVDDNVIRVRQTPVLMQKEPNVIPSLADPVRPVFQVYTRTAVGQTWTSVPWSNIEDYNVSTGEIILGRAIPADPTLVKVDYTTEQRSYYFKKFQDTVLNLNPYNGQSRNLIGQAIYVYVVPAYVKDSSNNVIGASVQTSTLRMTLNPEVFDSTQPSYDPLAALLGMVYISPALNINDIVLLDTRRRGGGALSSFSDSEIARLVQESSMYWDIKSGAGQSYQEAGYVVVRLPASLKEYFSESDIVDTIKRNVTVGVGFKVEDLNGNSW